MCTTVCWQEERGVYKWKKIVINTAVWSSEQQMGTAWEKWLGHSSVGVICKLQHLKDPMPSNAAKWVFQCQHPPNSTKDRVLHTDSLGMLPMCAWWTWSTCNPFVCYFWCNDADCHNNLRWKIYYIWAQRMLDVYSSHISHSKVAVMHMKAVCMLSMKNAH